MLKMRCLIRLDSVKVEASDQSSDTLLFERCGFRLSESFIGNGKTLLKVKRAPHSKMIEHFKELTDDCMTRCQLSRILGVLQGWIWIARS